jgi:hypothetical protein
MDSVTVIKVCEKHKKLVDSYFENDGKILYDMIDKILFKLKFDVDKSDFYSLGSEIFLDALCRYDETQDFNGFLYSCLTNKFKTEMTRRNRQKRQADKNAISIDTPIGDEDGTSTLGDMIAHHSTIEKEIFEEKEEVYSEEMNRYLSRLSNLQKEVLRLISIGFMTNEILEELHINQKMYEDCYNAIHSYRNVSLLF